VFELESQIRKWRTHVRHQTSMTAQDLDELECHLRDGIDDLTGRGVTAEEAFLVCVRRMGDAAAIGREFAKITTERVWRQLLVPAETETGRRRERVELAIVTALTLLGGLLSRIPLLLGYPGVTEAPLVYARNAALFALVPVALYLIWKRSLPARFVAGAAVTVVAGALIANLYPSYAPNHTAGLVAIHLPIALVLLLGVLYGGSGWRRPGVRLDYVRFAGEVFVFCVLLGLGGLVLVGVTTMMFSFLGLDINVFVADWLAPFGGLGVVVVAAYLVERKQSILESMAPVLARVFTPLFLVVLLGFVGAMVVTGRSPSEERAMLIWFDVLLAIVLGLVLYTMAARDAEAPHAPADALVLALLAVALVVDAIAFVGVASRLSDHGFSANRTAALGENVILFVNLLLLAIGYARFLAGRLRYQRIVDVQMRYLPVYAAWAVLVAATFPPLFGFR